MEDLSDIKILARNLKCLSSELQGYEAIRPINLIIGRNNAGKSTLIDMIEYAVANNNNYKIFTHKGNTPEIFIFGTDVLEEASLKRVFAPNTSGGEIGMNHWDFGKRFIGRQLNWKIGIPGDPTFLSIDPPEQHLRYSIDSYYQRLVQSKKNPLAAKSFRRLSSDRDIFPEGENHNISLSRNGQGATNLIRESFTRASYPTKKFRNILLTELNAIFQPDSVFLDITLQQLESGMWEVFLDEPDKGLIALSQSGSGLKTILLVLINLHLMPYYEKKNLSQYFFAFEELENNLHPALQRRLLLYLRTIALEKHCNFFLSTHSSIIIDLFSNDKSAQILHITNDGEKSSITKAVTYIEHKGILDDLDVRASDLLQSNGIVWVEGPSDRIYFKRWIEIWTKNQLIEGTHYQCVFYGGRLLAHLSATDPSIESEDLLKILRINRNAILIVDSDRGKEDDEVNATKRRLVSEIAGMKGLGWVTAGKEVENYIPTEVLRKHYSNNSLKPIGKFQPFHEYLEAIQPGDGERFLRSKVLYAESISLHFTRENLADTLDLKDRLDAISKEIMRWNRVTD